MTLQEIAEQFPVGARVRVKGDLPRYGNVTFTHKVPHSEHKNVVEIFEPACLWRGEATQFKCVAVRWDDESLASWAVVDAIEIAHQLDDDTPVNLAPEIIAMIECGDVDDSLLEINTAIISRLAVRKREAMEMEGAEND